MMKRCWILVVLLIGCVMVLGVSAEAAEPITIRINNQTLAYGQNPAQGEYEVIYPDSISYAKWYTSEVVLCADYENKQITAESVIIRNEDGMNVTSKYPIVVEPGTLKIRLSYLRTEESLSASAIQYGQSLAESTISGSMGYLAGGSFQALEGSWAWGTPTSRPEVSGDQWIAYYTLENEELRDYFDLGKAEIAVELLPTKPKITLSAPDAVMCGQTVVFSVSTENPYCSGFSAPSATVSYRIGDGAPQTVAGNSFLIPADTPMGTQIVLTAKTEADKEYTAASATVTMTVERLDFAQAVVELSAREFFYDGQPKEPAVTVTVGGRELTAGIDYTVSYAGNQDVGEAAVTINGIGDYCGTVNETFTIRPAVLTITAQNQSLIYGQRPDPTRFAVTFPAAMDSSLYTVSCRMTAHPAQGTITLHDAAVFCGETDVTGQFSIVCQEGTLTMIQSEPICQTAPSASAIRYGEALSASTISGEMGYRDENGNFVALLGEWTWGNPALCPEVKESQWAYFTVIDPALDDYFAPHTAHIQVELMAVMPSLELIVPETAMSGETVMVTVTAANLLNPDKVVPEYMLSYQIGAGVWQTAAMDKIIIPAGTPDGTCITIKAVTAASEDKYAAAQAIVSLTVRQISLMGGTVTLEMSSFAYDGSPKTPKVTVLLGDTALIENVDYIVSYADHTFVGTAAVTVTGIGRYMGSLMTGFVIEQGTPAYITPTALTGTIGQRLEEVKLPTSWSWDAPSFVLETPGMLTQSATYTPADINYRAVTVSLSLTVRAKAFSVTLSESELLYTGSEQKPTVMVAHEGLPLEAGVDYTLSWPTDCTNAGEKQIVVTGLGMYAGETKAVYTIAPADASAGYFSLHMPEEFPIYTGDSKPVDVQADPAYTGYGAITVHVLREGKTEKLLHTGTYQVCITMTQGINFNAITTPLEIGTVTIRPRTITVWAQDSGKVFGTQDPVLRYFTDGLIGEDQLNGALARDAGEQVGSYAIRQGTLAHPDYAITFVGATFSIRKAGAPAAPKVSGCAVRDGDGYTYTVDPIPGGEYKMDDGAWQSGNVFTGIAAGSRHVFYARTAETTDTEAGESDCLRVVFDRVSGRAEVKINGWTYGDAPCAPVPDSPTNGTDHVCYRYKAASATDAAFAADVPTDAGSYVVQAIFAETAQYTDAVAYAQFTIAPAPLNVRSVLAADRQYVPGNAAAVITAVELDGVLDADAGAVSVDCTGLFGVLNSENAGIYRAIKLPTLTLVGDKSENYRLIQPVAEIPTQVTISQADAPEAPTLIGWPEQNGDSCYTYTIQAISGAEYRMDDKAWQDSPVFAGLAAGSTHTFSARKKETMNIQAGNIGWITVTLDRAAGSAVVSLADWMFGEQPNRPIPISATNGTADVRYQYKPYGADDSLYTAVIPTAVGRYTLRAIFGETAQYDAVVATVDFSITPAMIERVEVVLSAPTVGAMPQKMIQGGKGWTGTVGWMPNDACFAYDTVYTATVMLSAEDNYRFAASVLAQGFTAAADGDGRLILTKVFAPTQKAAGEESSDQPVTVPYTGEAYDVSRLFAINAHGEHAVYALVGGTGEGSLVGNDLTVTRAGSFMISVSIPALGQYAAFHDVVQLTVEAGIAPAAIVGIPTAEAAVRVGDVLTLAVKGADGRTIHWAVTGPAEVSDGKVTVTGVGEVEVSAVLEANALYREQRLRYTFCAEPKSVERPMMIPTAVLLIDAGDGGHISHAGRNLVVYGSTHHFTVTPDPGYRIADVMVDGVSMGAIERVTVRVRGMICRIEASFAPEEYCSETDDTTSADLPATRGGLIEKLWQMEGCPVAECAADFFDVDLAHPLSAAVRWAAAAGIAQGYGNGLFGLDDPLTCAQSAAILYRYAATRGIVCERIEQSDGNWDDEAMNWAAANGLFASDAAPEAVLDKATLADCLARLCAKG